MERSTGRDRVPRPPVVASGVDRQIPRRRPDRTPVKGRFVRAKARHILVDSAEVAESLKADIEGGADFGDVAREHSSCPSGREGGDLGEFGRGQMVPEFDEVVFSAEVGKTHGPVQTQFGYHLIEITSRTE